MPSGAAADVYGSGRLSLSACLSVRQRGYPDHTDEARQ